MDFLKIAISGYKKIFIILVLSLIFIFSGISTSDKISAQMPPMGNMGGMGGGMPGGGGMGGPGGGGMGGMAMTYEPSNCRENPGTGEVFCDIKLDVSMMGMTQTTSNYKYYEGQGVWFQGCMLPGQDFENYDTAWIERQFIGEARNDAADPTAMVTHIYFRGNMPTQPGDMMAKCKYQFFTEDSPLVQPGGPYHSPQWEADQETQKIYEEADRVRREGERKRAEEELLFAKQQAELDLQRQEEQRKQQSQQNNNNNNQGGIQNIFGQSPVGNIFGNQTFQAPPDNEVPIGPYVNLTQIQVEDRWTVMECIATAVDERGGMGWEQAYMEFSFPLGVRALNEPDFYLDAVTSCMHLSFSKLLSGGFGGRTSSTGEAPREEINAMMEACIVPHLSNTLGVPQNIIIEDMTNVEMGKRSVSDEEMRAAYDCWNTFNNGNVADGYFPLDTDLLVSYTFGDQEIPGQACMVDSISRGRIDRENAQRIVEDFVNFAVGRQDQWGFLESDAQPQMKNDVVNGVIGCNPELEWVRDYQSSLQNSGDSLGNLDFVRIQEPDFSECIVNGFKSNGLKNSQDTYFAIKDGLIDHQDPTEIINRPLGEDQFHTIIDCVDIINADNLQVEAMEPYLQQYTTMLNNIELSWWPNNMDEGEKFDHLQGCILDEAKTGFKFSTNKPNFGKPDVVADLIDRIFFIGGDLNQNNLISREYDKPELQAVQTCLDQRPEFDWITQIYSSNFDYEPLFESDIFTQSSGDFEKSAADFRQTIQSDAQQGNMDGNMLSGSLVGGGALENLRQELVNMSIGSSAEECMVANLARQKQETESYIRTSYIDGLIWSPNKRPSKKEHIALQNCESQIRSATQGKGGLNALLKYGTSGDPDYFSQPSDSQRACMINEYSKQFGYMIESTGAEPNEAAAKAVAEVSMPGEYDGYHPLLGEKAPNLRPASAIEFEAFSKCKIYELHVYEGSKLRKLIPGIDPGDLPIGDLSNPTNLAIAGILITLFFSMLQMVRGK
tara:strand:- start:2621 stop:5635 length:3015 start_codon:yes stop_codon:yes gene_type:complete